MEYKDYYKILGVSRDAKADEIKRSYRKLARKFHPDVSKEPEAESRFKEMKEAYEVLKDAEKRAAYDQFGANWKAGQNFDPPPQWREQHSFRDRDFTDAGQFSDFFEELFGARAQRARSGRGNSGIQRPGDDVTARIAISVEDAFNGATRQLSLEVPELEDTGRVRHRRRSLNVRIPKGIRAGQRIRLEGQGGAALGGARAGDLYLEVEFEPHPVYQVKGRDIYVTLPITPSEAVLGRSVKAPTLGGAVDLKVPAGSSTGKSLRLKGRGLPGKPPGDQYVELEIVVPPNSSERERALYEQLEQEQSFNPRANLEASK